MDMRSKELLQMQRDIEHKQYYQRHGHHASSSASSQQHNKQHTHAARHNRQQHQHYIELQKDARACHEA